MNSKIELQLRFPGVINEKNSDHVSSCRGVLSGRSLISVAASGASH
jgi:hypothetical protein